MTIEELKKYFDRRFAELEDLKIYIDRRFAELERRTSPNSGMMRLDGGFWPTIPMSEAQTGGFTFEEKWETVQPPPKEAEKTEEPAKPEPEPPTTPEILAQVVALLSAAKEGKPFCEECEKAKSEIQVVTLRKASESGAPFCEECEKAKKEIKSKKKK